MTSEMPAFPSLEFLVSIILADPPATLVTSQAQTVKGN